MHERLTLRDDRAAHITLRGNETELGSGAAVHTVAGRVLDQPFQLYLYGEDLHAASDA